MRHPSPQRPRRPSRRFRSSSLQPWTTGLVSGALTASIWLYVSAAGWSESHGALTATGAGLAVALVVAICSAVTLQAVEAELRMLAQQIRHATRSEPDGAAPAPDTPRRGDHRLLGMAEVRDAIAHFAAHFTRRAEQAQAQRREVDILSRLAQAQRQQMESVLDLMSDAVLVTDPFNDLALANEAARRLLHIEGPGPRRQPLDRVLGDPSLVALIKGASEAVGSGAALRRQVEHRLGATPDDAFTSVFEVTLASLDDRRSTSPSRGGAGLVTVLRDVTRERAIAQMKSDFVNAVSHEMRTPLSSILAYLELLVDGEAGDEATRRRFYAVLQSETERLKRLIDNILNLSRIEAGAVRVQRERIDLRDVARQAVEVIRPQARAKRIEVAQAIAPLPLLVLADRDMMDQALLNLLSNAVKYTPEGGRVMLSADVDDARASAVVCVSDNGVGIPAQDLPRVFEKFYRVADHAGMAKGTGLGLSLVKQIIEAVHGGRIEVQSRPGAGAAFTFTLPLADYPC